jgi:hypothetical protein
MSRLSFSIERSNNNGPLAVVPRIDGTPLTDLVAAFEGGRHFEPAGAYGGIIPELFDYGPIDRYFMGEWAESGGIYVLGCDCGEAGCWPLLCRVKRDGAAIVWDSFRQPYRAERDYSQFGPFIFDAAQYTAAVELLQAQLTSPSPRRNE